MTSKYTVYEFAIEYMDWPEDNISLAMYLSRFRLDNSLVLTIL